MSRLERTCSIDDCGSPVWSREMCSKHYMRWHTHGDATFVREAHAPAGAPAAFMEGLPSRGEGCLTWPFATNGAGYAQINLKGRKHLVSRLVCGRTHGPPPTSRHMAAHSCGKGHEGCIAPWHLTWKTVLENNHDMDAHGTRILGEDHANAKLTADDVRAIRALIGTRTQAEIGEQFGVDQTIISRIARRKAWAHVDPIARAA